MAFIDSDSRESAGNDGGGDEGNDMQQISPSCSWTRAVAVNAFNPKSTRAPCSKSACLCECVFLYAACYSHRLIQQQHQEGTEIKKSNYQWWTSSSWQVCLWSTYKYSHNTCQSRLQRIFTFLLDFHQGCNNLSIERKLIRHCFDSSSCQFFEFFK